MATLAETINKLEYIQRLSENPNSFSSRDTKEKANDTPLIKALKGSIERSKAIANLKTVYKLEKDKVKDREKIITDKDDQIFKLSAVLGANILMLRNQENHIDQLIQALETERDRVSTTADLKKHLQTDIKRLAGERKDLTKAIKDLGDEEVKNKATRDQELADLRIELDK
jgi:hypothetical protein